MFNVCSKVTSSFPPQNLMLATSGLYSIVEQSKAYFSTKSVTITHSVPCTVELIGIVHFHHKQ